MPSSQTERITLSVCDEFSLISSILYRRNGEARIIDLLLITATRSPLVIDQLLTYWLQQITQTLEPAEP